MTICFDTKTLIKNGEPRKEVITLLKALSKNRANQIVIWSEKGADDASSWGRKLKIDNLIWAYWPKEGERPVRVDLTIDTKVIDVGMASLTIVDNK